MEKEKISALFVSGDKEMIKLAQRICSKYRISYWVLVRVSPPDARIRMRGICRYLLEDNPTYQVGLQSLTYTPKNQHIRWKIFKIDFDKRKK